MSLSKWVREKGWGAKYATAFDNFGMEKVSDLALLDDDLRDQLEEELLNVAKPFKVAQFMKLVDKASHGKQSDGSQW